MAAVAVLAAMRGDRLVVVTVALILAITVLDGSVIGMSLPLTLSPPVDPDAASGPLVISTANAAGGTVISDRYIVLE